MSARDPFQPKQVVSRRGGPVKEPLSRDAIVTAAFDLLTREGLDGMSLRRVAAALDTGPASLYVYVEDLQELRALVLDKALGEVQIPSTKHGNWRTRLMALLESYAKVLIDKPGLAQLSMSTVAAGPNALRFLEAQLGLLEEAGVGEATAAWAVDLMCLYVSAIAAEESHRGNDVDALGPITRVLGNVSESDHPRIYALRHQLLAGTASDRFAWALEVLLAGFLQAPPVAAVPTIPRPAHKRDTRSDSGQGDSGRSDSGRADSPRSRRTPRRKRDT